MLPSAVGMVNKEATLGGLLSYCCPYSQGKKREEKESFLLCCPPASKSMRSQRLYLSLPHMSAQFHIFYMPAQCVL